MRIGISLADLSAEHHVALLADKLTSLLAAQGDTLQLFGLGSKRLSTMRAELFANIADFSSIGVFDGYANAARLLLSHKTTPDGLVGSFVQFLLDREPDVVILSDAKALNLKVARALRKLGYEKPIVYYVAPVCWESCLDAHYFETPRNLDRIGVFRDLVDYFFLIYPVSLDAYARLNLPHAYIGHPMVELVNTALDRRALVRSAHAQGISLEINAPWVGVFPGSRRSEMAAIAPTVFDAVKMLAYNYGYCEFISCPGRGEFKEDIEKLARDRDIAERVKVLDERFAIDVLANSRAAIIKSGTILHLACMSLTPSVMVYGFPRFQSYIARNLLGFNMKYYGLPNLLTGGEVVPELVGARFTSERISIELSHLLFEGEKRAKMLESLQEVSQMLVRSDPLGSAARKILELVCK